MPRPLARLREEKAHDGAFHWRWPWCGRPHHHAAAISSPAARCASTQAHGAAGIARPCPAGARIVDTAPLSLDEIIEECARATTAGEDVARLHSGDVSIWSALGEQLARLDGRGIPYTITPGVPHSLLLLLRSPVS